MASNNEKLGEVILHIARKCENAALFGKIKLNKILFFADARSFLERGRPITDASYTKENFGPVPVRMDETIHRLVDVGAAFVEERPMPDLTVQKRVIAKRRADLDRVELTGDDIALLDETIEWIRPMSAAQVSELSHKSTGWMAARMGEAIPLATVLIPDRPLPLTSEDIQFGEAIGKRLAEAHAE